MEISVPKVGLMLTQWTGRLIRTEEDIGMVTIADTRIVTKKYGKLLIKGLPPFDRVRCSFPEAA